VDGYGTVAQHVDPLDEARGLLIDSADHFLTQALRAHASYALPQERIRQEAAFGQTKQTASGELRR
jgi:hypothetical protein